MPKKSSSSKMPTRKRVFSLYSPTTRKVLSIAEFLDAKGLCLVPELKYKDEDLTKLLDSLKTTKMRKLATVLDDVIESILNQHHGDNKPSESDALLIWGSILKDGRPKGTSLPSTSGVKVQLRKNIKIARSVMVELSKFGLDCPLSSQSMNIFIENTALHLKNLQDEEEGDEEEAEESENEGGLDEVIEIIDWNDIVLHTPTKSRTARTMVGVLKPNNHRFQRRLQEAKVERDEDDDEDDDEEYKDSEEKY
ncbi:hypothetical protein EC957_007989 [Mortierella hygrophila]|uniref:Uncharacterized protein n=1 Tax=Mortierella hygrophila TaxID=979708 RepID=A0A9P6EXC8_9FUNG|nr:hypothetical protein EC957_007989 [Mortierella hygrophila]